EPTPTPPGEPPGGVRLFVLVTIPILWPDSARIGGPDGIGRWASWTIIAILVGAFIIVRESRELFAVTSNSYPKNDEQDERNQSKRARNHYHRLARQSGHQVKSERKNPDDRLGKSNSFTVITAIV